MKHFTANVVANRRGRESGGNTRVKSQAMTAANASRQAPPATMTIFGAAGDLTKRLVVPALNDLVRAGEFSVTGLTSNPAIFGHAIKNSNGYDTAIRKKLKAGKSGEELFFDLALEDITAAAGLFRPVHDRTAGVDGWVSFEVSPLLAHDTKATAAAAKELHACAGRR